MALQNFLSFVALSKFCFFTLDSLFWSAKNISGVTLCYRMIILPSVSLLSVKLSWASFLIVCSSNFICLILFIVSSYFSLKLIRWPHVHSIVFSEQAPKNKSVSLEAYSSSVNYMASDREIAGFEELPLNCCSQVHPDPGWQLMLGSHLWTNSCPTKHKHYEGR